MFKTLIAGVTALSLSVTPLQAQEFDNEDFGKFLFGLVAAGIVASALSQRNSDDDAHQSYHQPSAPALNPNRYEPPVVQHRNHANAPRLNPNRGNGHGIAPHRNAQVLPGRCFRTLETRFGRQNIFAKRCLTRNYQFAANLPRKCAVRVLTRQGARNGYDPLCLRREGYTSTRRH